MSKLTVYGEILGFGGGWGYDYLKKYFTGSLKDSAEKSKFVRAGISK